MTAQLRQFLAANPHWRQQRAGQFGRVDVLAVVDAERDGRWRYRLGLAGGPHRDGADRYAGPEHAMRAADLALASTAMSELPEWFMAADLASAPPASAPSPALLALRAARRYLATLPDLAAAPTPVPAYPGWARRPAYEFVIEAWQHPARGHEVRHVPHGWRYRTAGTAWMAAAFGTCAEAMAAALGYGVFFQGSLGSWQWGGPGFDNVDGVTYATAEEAALAAVRHAEGPW